MGITLEAIDAVRARTGASHRRAYLALHGAGGDVTEAVRTLGAGCWPCRRAPGPRLGRGLGHGVRRLVAEGNATRVVVRSSEGRTMVAVPATVAVAGSLLFPLAAVAGVAVAVAGQASIAVER